MTEFNRDLEALGNTAKELFERGRYKEALQKYKMVAEAGSRAAQLRVGWMYHTGHGVKVALDEARRWYVMAADAADSNSLEAQFYLGTLYVTEKQYGKAMELFKQCAEQSYMPAIYQLGRMYELGEGVNADKEKAIRYYEQAARAGHLMAQREIAGVMTKGGFGFTRIPQGVFMLLRVLWSIFRLGLKDPNSERIRW